MPIDQTTSPDNEEMTRSRRIGTSPFRLQLAQEQYAMTGSASWRLIIAYKPPRARKQALELPLIDVSPRHPLFTLTVGGESFPLMITRCEDAARGALILGGTRKLMLKAIHTVEWEAKLRPTGSRAGTQIKVEFKASVNPPLPGRTPGDLKIEVFSPMLAPEPWWFPYAPETHRGAASLWAESSGTALSVALPGATSAQSGIVQSASASTSLIETVVGAVRRSRGAYTFFVHLGVARTRSHAQFLHMRHTAQTLAPGLPELPAAPPSAGLRDHALLALQRLTDKGAYDVAGVERVYVKSHENAESGAPEFCAGFPHFPLDGARAMLDWHELIGDETGSRLALLIARGIATDFMVLGRGGDYGVGINRGAFWERRRGPAGTPEAAFTDSMGDDLHSIGSTARIARGLFGVYERTGDTLSYNGAISACQWLLLKQNGHGYYDGDRVCAVTGAVIDGGETLAGIETIGPFVQAFRATRNEVFIKAAMRVARHITSVLMPGLVACPIYRTRFLTGVDTPASVASLIRALAFAHSEAGSRRTHEELEMAGVWLRAWDLTRIERYENLNCDGHSDGLYEIARAALQLLAVFKEPVWMETALRIAASLPPEAHDGWQALPLFMETMLGLVSLAPNCRADLHAYTARAGWTDFAADSTTNHYISVQADDQPEIAVDHLPLVSTVDTRVLIPVLAHGAVERVRINNNGKEPNLRDLITGEIVCQPAPLHKLPFTSPMRWGCFTIDP